VWLQPENWHHPNEEMGIFKMKIMKVDKGIAWAEIELGSCGRKGRAESEIPWSTCRIQEFERSKLKRDTGNRLNAPAP
jgi:hypothetical protein